ncbi:ATP-binding cassette domain-containing protein [Limibaculum sp. FT325]|uniref:ABC transporter ATP-binding protein n=1 Tax=Thermohalobaculum sediminis TaxID=2939436 RepID=UPI0020BEFEDD|nr:ABC transporter ATP-binding protein [Limibaculum sediminis]MCL5776901.1 ATP-binding cassette domain-containing protein [Limibaculum sediminis]
MSLIDIQSPRHCFRTAAGPVWALDGVSLAIRAGEFVAVMGPSGSGKSTFMSILGCLDRPTEGRYRLAGVDVASLAADRLAALRNRGIDFVFQSFNLLPRATALENVGLPLIDRPMRASERRRCALAMLECLGLADRAGHMPSQLSGGQQQRVAIARALVGEPLVLLADEPTVALDSRTGGEILDLFRKFNAEGLTIVMVTHDAGVAARAGRTVTFRDGRVAPPNGAPHAFAPPNGAPHTFAPPNGAPHIFAPPNGAPPIVAIGEH